MESSLILSKHPQYCHQVLPWAKDSWRSARVSSLWNQTSSTLFFSQGSLHGHRFTDNVCTVNIVHCIGTIVKALLNCGLFYICMKFRSLPLNKLKFICLHRLSPMIQLAPQKMSWLPWANFIKSSSHSCRGNMFHSQIIITHLKFKLGLRFSIVTNVTSF